MKTEVGLCVVMCVLLKVCSGHAGEKTTHRYFSCCCFYTVFYKMFDKNASKIHLVLKVFNNTFVNIASRNFPTKYGSISITITLRVGLFCTFFFLSAKSCITVNLSIKFKND